MFQHFLNIKLEELERCTPVEKQKGEGKINETLVKMRNVMKELDTLASDHGVEHSLYHSSNLAKIYGLLGKKRHVDITKNLLDFDTDDKAMWKHVLDSLDREIRVNEQILLYHTDSPSRTDGRPDGKGGSDGKGGYHSDGFGQKVIVISVTKLATWKQRPGRDIPS